jgi:hypothetical protein
MAPLPPHGAPVEAADEVILDVDVVTGVQGERLMRL